MVLISGSAGGGTGNGNASTSVEDDQQTTPTSGILFGGGHLPSGTARLTPTGTVVPAPLLTVLSAPSQETSSISPTLSNAPAPVQQAVAVAQSSSISPTTSSPVSTFISAPSIVAPPVPPVPAVPQFISTSGVPTYSPPGGLTSIPTTGEYYTVESPYMPGNPNRAVFYFRSQKQAQSYANYINNQLTNYQKSVTAYNSEVRAYNHWASTNEPYNLLSVGGSLWSLGARQQQAQYYRANLQSENSFLELQTAEENALMNEVMPGQNGDYILSYGQVSHHGGPQYPTPPTTMKFVSRSEARDVIDSIVAGGSIYNAGDLYFGSEGSLTNYQSSLNPYSITVGGQSFSGKTQQEAIQNAADYLNNNYVVFDKSGNIVLVTSSMDATKPYYAEGSGYQVFAPGQLNARLGTSTYGPWASNEAQQQTVASSPALTFSPTGTAIAPLGTNFLPSLGVGGSLITAWLRAPETYSVLTNDVLDWTNEQHNPALRFTGFVGAELASIAVGATTILTANISPAIALGSQHPLLIPSEAIGAGLGLVAFGEGIKSFESQTGVSGLGFAGKTAARIGEGAAFGAANSIFNGQNPIDAALVGGVTFGGMSAAADLAPAALDAIPNSKAFQYLRLYSDVAYQGFRSSISPFVSDITEMGSSFSHGMQDAFGPDLTEIWGVTRRALTILPEQFVEDLSPAVSKLVSVTGDMAAELRDTVRPAILGTFDAFGPPLREIGLGLYEGAAIPARALASDLAPAFVGLAETTGEMASEIGSVIAGAARGSYYALADGFDPHFLSDFITGVTAPGRQLVADTGVAWSNIVAGTGSMASEVTDVLSTGVRGTLDAFAPQFSVLGDSFYDSLTVFNPELRQLGGFIQDAVARPLEPLAFSNMYDLDTALRVDLGNPPLRIGLNLREPDALPLLEQYNVPKQLGVPEFGGSTPGQALFVPGDPYSTVFVEQPGESIVSNPQSGVFGARGPPTIESSTIGATPPRIASEIDLIDSALLSNRDLETLIGASDYSSFVEGLESHAPEKSATATSNAAFASSIRRTTSLANEDSLTGFQALGSNATKQAERETWAAEIDRRLGLENDSGATQSENRGASESTVTVQTSPLEEEVPQQSSTLDEAINEARTQAENRASIVRSFARGGQSDDTGWMFATTPESFTGTVDAMTGGSILPQSYEETRLAIDAYTGIRAGTTPSLWQEPSTKIKSILTPATRLPTMLTTPWSFSIPNLDTQPWQADILANEFSLATSLLLKQQEEVALTFDMEALQLPDTSYKLLTSRIAPPSMFPGIWTKKATHKSVSKLRFVGYERKNQFSENLAASFGEIGLELTAGLSSLGELDDVLVSGTSRAARHKRTR